MGTLLVCRRSRNIVSPPPAPPQPNTPSASADSVCGAGLLIHLRRLAPAVPAARRVRFPIYTHLSEVEVMRYDEKLAPDGALLSSATFHAAGGCLAPALVLRLKCMYPSSPAVSSPSSVCAHGNGNTTTRTARRVRVRHGERVLVGGGGGWGRRTQIGEGCAPEEDEPEMWRVSVEA